MFTKCLAQLQCMKGVYGRREDAAKPTCMSARALARLAVPRKLTSTVLVFQANNT